MRQRSFTLIEILISITIIAIFSGITLASYNGFTEDQKLKSESKKLISVLELAKKSASAGVSDPTSCSIFDGYKVVFKTSYYELQRRCNSSDVPVQRYNFPENTTVKTEGEILFQPLSLGAKNLTLAPTTTITIRYKLIKCIDITIRLSTIDETEVKTIGCS